MKTYLFLAFGFSAMILFQSCQKDTAGTTPSGNGGNGLPTSADSIYIPASIRWTNFGFGSSGTLAIGVVYDAQKRVTQIGGSNSVYVRQFYYADGRISHITAESPKTFSTQKERNSIVFKYSGNKIVKAIYKVNSFLPETDPYYSDTVRTDNNNGYYDSLVYSGNNLTEIYHKSSFFTPPVVYTFLIKYPNGADSTYSIQEFSGTTVLKNKISGKVSSIANPYSPYWALFFHSFNGLEYSLFYPYPLRKDSYECEYLLPLLPKAISNFKVEWFTGAYSVEQGTYLYQMSADSLNLRMTNPGNSTYNYERIDFSYNRLHR